MNNTDNRTDRQKAYDSILVLAQGLARREYDPAAAATEIYNVVFFLKSLDLRDEQIATRANLLARPVTSTSTPN